MSSSRKRKRQKTTVSSSTVSVYPPKSLLYGHDAKILDAIAHVGIGDTCTLTVHNALVELGLGWLCIGDHAHRPVCGSIYTRAKALAVSSGQHLLKPKLSTIKVEDRVLNNSHHYTSTDQDCILSPEDAKSILKSIRETGMALIRGAVDVSKIEIEKCEDTTKTPKRIQATTGNGKAGIEDYKHPKNDNIYGSYYNDMNKITYLDDIQNSLYESLTTVAGKKKKMLQNKKKKYIYLRYTKGGENWAHRDGNNDTIFPYQAVLMLSNAKEYGGGEFYVATKEESLIVRTSCPKLNAGDLVIFQAGKDGNYYHGMRTVTSGERKAIGLFQEVAKSK